MRFSRFLNIGALALLSVGFLLSVEPVRGVNARGRAPLDAPANAGELERFIDRCRRERRPYKLSLASLVEDFNAASLRPAGVPLSLRHLRGFTWFFGYVIDREKNDVQLLGIVDPDAPTIDLDCLVTAMRSAFDGRTPICSLDPHPDPRYQKTRIDGVPRQSLWAQIMIDADYDMKKIGQGKLDPRLPGLESWFDQVVRRLKSEYKPNFHQLNRWWFNRPVREVPRTLLLDDEGDVVMLYQNPVVLLTEQNVNGKFGTGTVAPEAARFAEQFTRNMPALAKKYPSIAKLLVLYRLLDLAVHLRTVGKVYPPYPDFWLRDYQSPYEGPSEKKKTLTRHLKWRVGTGGYTFTIRGGVRMPLDLDANKVRKEVHKDLARKLKNL